MYTNVLVLEICSIFTLIVMFDTDNSHIDMNLFTQSLLRHNYRLILCLNDVL